jgi:acyl-CoA hydrolase
MSVQSLYQQKRMSPADAIAVVQNGDTIVVPTGVGEPPALLNALSEARRNYREVKVSQILPLRKYGYIDPETQENIRHVAYFFGGVTRPGGQEGWIDYLPAYFSELPVLIERGLSPSEIVFSMASPMDEHGYFSLSLGSDYTMAAVQKARAVVLEINPHVPFANGNCHIHISEVAALTESSEPLLEVGLPKIGPVQEAIGSYVAEMIPNGATCRSATAAFPTRWSCS